MSDLTGLMGQHEYPIRFDWGPVGARATAADIAVVVDVLSFSTSVCIAVERGMRVYPYPWKDDRAEAAALELDAVLAVGRLEATKPGVISAPSLSPAILRKCQWVPRLVLPSPNGSTIAAALCDSGSAVIAGCLRNSKAVADWLAMRLDQGRSVAVIAAGERWAYDDSLRPALEDQLGSGSILSVLAQRGARARMSPEASAVVDQFDSLREDLPQRISECAGARELSAKGFRADVDAALELNVSSTVPVLSNGSFGSD